MRQSIHAHVRSVERTKLNPTDIMIILEKKLTVLLGTVEGVSFHLFYSIADKNCKIALVSNGGKQPTVITVWKQYFRLPKGITQVTKENRKEARDIVGSYLCPEKQKAQDVLVVQVIEKTKVHKNSLKMIHHVSTLPILLPELFLEKDKDERFATVLFCMKSEVEEILSAVESCFEIVPDTIAFRLKLLYSDGKILLFKTKRLRELRECLDKLP